MGKAFQRRPAAFLVAVVLLFTILAVVVSPVVDLPNCALRAKRVAITFQWLLTMVLACVTLVLRPEDLFARIEWLPDPPRPLLPCDPDLTCARLR